MDNMSLAVAVFSIVISAVAVQIGLLAHLDHTYTHVHRAVDAVLRGNAADAAPSDLADRQRRVDRLERRAARLYRWSWPTRLLIRRPGGGRWR